MTATPYAEQIKALEERLGYIENQEGRLWADYAEMRAQDLLSGRVTSSLTRADQQLLERHRSRARLGERIEAATRDFEDSEEKRRRHLHEVEAIAQEAQAHYQSLLEQIRASLSESREYEQTAKDFEQARRTIADLDGRLEAARSEKASKTRDFEADPLFMHLLQRDYATARYQRQGWAKKIDDWIARVIDFRSSHANYRLLQEMPEWLEENRERVAAAAAECEHRLTEHWNNASRAQELRHLKKSAAHAHEEAASLAERQAAERAEDERLIALREAYIAGEDDSAQEIAKSFRESYADQPLVALRDLAAESDSHECMEIVNQMTLLAMRKRDLVQRIESLQPVDDDEH